MEPTLILFAGMPGGGKTTLARQIARRLSIPVFAKDRVQRVLRDHNLADASSGDGYYIILDMVDEQLGLGLSCMLDATFPLDHFRMVASEIAQRHKARLCAIYCYCSDDLVWQERMKDRVHYVPNWKPVGWQDVLRMREYYQPWNDNALFVDSVRSPDENIPIVLDHIAAATTRPYMPHQPTEGREWWEG
ncbi:MAG: AAA family ATPase [Anaerolineae bacterium]